MLPEIFQSICDELQQHLASNQTGKKKWSLQVGPVKKKSSKEQINIELLSCGNIATPSSADSPVKSLYSFSFCILPNNFIYEDTLNILEKICDHFDQKPFVQVNISGKEFEVALTSMELPLETINHFWIARKQAHSPALFYQGRISES